MPSKPMSVVPFRLPLDLVKRLDRHAERMKKEHPGMTVTRADAVRSLLIAGLDREEARYGQKT